eukprot:scaffold127362_cov69-Phaeocystis_antarctica.AAC.2
MLSISARRSELRMRMIEDESGFCSIAGRAVSVQTNGGGVGPARCRVTEANKEVLAASRWSSKHKGWREAAERWRAHGVAKRWPIQGENGSSGPSGPVTSVRAEKRPTASGRACGAPQF